jgi:hypothetical protein
VDKAGREALLLEENNAGLSTSLRFGRDDNGVAILALVEMTTGGGIPALQGRRVVDAG